MMMNIVKFTITTFALFVAASVAAAEQRPQWGVLQSRDDGTKAFIPLSDVLVEFSAGNWQCQFQTAHGATRTGVCKSGKNTVSLSATISNKLEGKSMEWFETQNNKYYLAWRR